MIINMDFYIGKAEGNCTVYYQPPEYEGYLLFYPEFIEFDNVYIQNKKIPFKKINKVLFNSMLKTFKNYYLEVLQ